MTAARSYTLARVLEFLALAEHDLAHSPGSLEVFRIMEEARESAQCAVNAVCDALKYLGDASYAVLPRDIAHGLGDFKKAVLEQLAFAD